MTESLQKRIGDIGEDLACRYLEDKDFAILERNFVMTWSGAEKCEIDVIARHADIIHFVEVKTIMLYTDNYRSNFFQALSKINYSKRKKIEKAMEYWIIKTKGRFGEKYQIDALAVNILNDFKGAKIKFVENV